MSMFPTRSRLLDELMGDLGGFYIKPAAWQSAASKDIKVDIEETGDVYKVQAELPGVKKDDIHVEIDGAVVSIKAEIQQKNSTGEGSRNLHSERYYGSVSRRFELPAEIDPRKTHKPVMKKAYCTCCYLSAKRWKTAASSV